MIYALTLMVCLSGGQCVTVVPEVYTDLTRCVIEAAHQRRKGSGQVYCEEMTEESIAGL